MKQADDFKVARLLDICRYIKWINVTEEEFNKLQEEANDTK